MAHLETAWPFGDGEMIRLIRAFDWAATSLGPIDGWSERLKIMVEQILASPLVATIVCGPGRLLIYNEAAAKLYGAHHPAAFGRPLPATFPEGWATVAPHYDRAFAGETVQVAGQPLDTRGEGGAADTFDALLTPMRESDGHVAYVHMTGTEVSERSRMEAALRASEERYRSLFQNMGQGYCDLALLRDRNGRAFDQIYLELNPAFERLFGVPAAEAKGRTAHELFPDLEPWWYEAFDRVTRRGETERIEYEFAALGRWFEVFAHPRGGDRLTVFYEDITARKLAEFALHDAEKRQAFLLKLSDALRPLRDAGEVRARACRLLGEHLSASRVYYVEYQPEQGYGIVTDDYLVPGLPSLAGYYPFEAFRATYRRIGNGCTWIVPDVSADRALPDNERAYYAAQGVIAWINVPLVKAGVLEAALCVVQTEARDWTASDITLVDETAERLWAAIQRGRSEAELSESEERFRQFATASSAALWVRNAETLKMEYVSPAIEPIYGIEPETFLNGVEVWASAIVPDDRASALDYLERARQGEAAVHEFRIQRLSDGAFRWIRNTDFPLFDARGQVQRIGGIAEDVTEARLAVEHQGVLLAELQHRVRNIMAQIRSITARTGERAESVSAYADLMAGRLMTFARVQALLTRSANVGARIVDIVHDELAAQAGRPEQYTLDGPDLVLAPKTAEVLTLAVHELTTNALKYGGLAVPGGRVTVRWATFDRRGTSWLGLDWSETGMPDRIPPSPGTQRHRGFGSELIEGRIPYELGGRGELSMGSGGARCRLEFPLQDGPSILETDAPRRAAVYGGALDMTGEGDLTGHRILVVEDDYYLATDTARALKGVGAEVIGPCPTEAAARIALADARPTGAVLDLNLGDTGPSFVLAAELRARAVPFILVTGYDAAVVPAEFETVTRLQKPVHLRQIVGALATALDIAHGL